MAAAMVPRSPLDDPATAGFAWARYRRLMKGMAAVTLVVVIASLAVLYRSDGFVSIHFFIATALGIGAAMMLMAALMGLVFLSHGTGHDDSIVDPFKDEENR
jgi:hypothetical protein